MSNTPKKTSKKTNQIPVEQGEVIKTQSIDEKKVVLNLDSSEFMKMGMDSLSDSKEYAIVDLFFQGFKDGSHIREDFSKGDVLTGVCAVNAVNFCWAHWATAEELAAIKDNIKNDNGNTDA